MPDGQDSTGGVTLDFSKAQPITTGQTGGVTLDFSKAQPVGSTPAPAPAGPQPIHTPVGTLTPIANQQPQQATIAPLEQPKGPAQQFARWAGNVMNDLEYGTDHTGVGTVLKKMGAHGVDMGNSEQVGNFMASIPLGLLRFYKGMAETTNTGHAAAVWQGIKDTVGGALQASTMPASFIAPESEALPDLMDTASEMTAGAARATAGKAAAAARATGRAATAPIRAARELYTGEAANAKVQEDLAEGVRNVFEDVASDHNVQLPENIQSVTDVPAHLSDALRQGPKPVANEAEAAATAQNELQKGIRNVVTGTAKDAGVEAKESQSIRDAAANVSDALHEKATGIYKQLDDALGGTRFQAFGQQIRKLDEALRNTTGTDLDAQGELIEQRNAVQAKMEAAVEDLKAKGVDPKLIKDATDTFRQHKGMEALSNNIRATARGLRPELRQTGQEATAETLHPDQLAARLNKMYDTGVLQDTVGESRAQDLLRHADRAQLATPKTTAALRSQSDAVDQVTKVLRDAAEGMHPEDVKPGVRATPQTFNIDKLFHNLRALRDNGALQEALGPQRARELMQEVDAAHLRNADIASRVKLTKQITKFTTGVAGVGTAGEAVREVFSK